MINLRCSNIKVLRADGTFVRKKKKKKKSMVCYLLRYCCFLIIIFLMVSTLSYCLFCSSPFPPSRSLTSGKPGLKLTRASVITWCSLPTFRSFTILSEQGGAQSMFTAPWPVVTSLLRALLIWTTSLLKNG